MRSENSPTTSPAAISDPLNMKPEKSETVPSALKWYCHQSVSVVVRIDSATPTASIPITVAARRDDVAHATIVCPGMRNVRACRRMPVVGGCSAVVVISSGGVACAQRPQFRPPAETAPPHEC